MYSSKSTRAASAGSAFCRSLWVTRRTPRTRRKSALPKDQGVAAIYQAELARALDECTPLLRGVVAIDRARALCHPDRTLYESERALAFRLICLSHWARAYEVRMP